MSPVNLSSRQQDFSLVAIQTIPLDFASRPVPQPLPLFSFVRDDTGHTCKLSERVVTLGPLALANESGSINAIVRSSSADVPHTGDLFDAVATVLNAIPFNPGTPVIGATVQSGVSGALKQFDRYLSNNMQLQTTTEATLLPMELNNMRAGQLAYSAILYIHKHNSFSGDSQLEIGDLVLHVKTRLSLFTPAVRKIEKSGGGSALNTDIGLPLSYVPDFRGYESVWTALVKPVISDSTVQLSQAIDMLPAFLPHEQIIGDLTNLSDNSKPAEIQKFCRELKDRARQLMFDEEDVLAIVASALAESTPWRDGASNMRTDGHGCFAAREVAILNAMGMLPGNEPPATPKT